MAGGRPTDYDKKYCEMVIELGRQGKSVAQMAAALDICKKTIYNWSDEHPEFLHALTRARDYSQAWWEEVGQEGLTTPGFNANLWNKSMSARFPDDYTDRNKTEHSGTIRMTHERILDELE